MEVLHDDVKKEMTLENYKYALQLADKILRAIDSTNPLTTDDARDIMSSLFLILSSGNSPAAKLRLTGRCSSFEELKNFINDFLRHLESDIEQKNPM